MDNKSSALLHAFVALVVLPVCVKTHPQKIFDYYSAFWVNLSCTFFLFLFTSFTLYWVLFLNGGGGGASVYKSDGISWLVVVCPWCPKHSIWMRSFSGLLQWLSCVRTQLPAIARFNYVFQLCTSKNVGFDISNALNITCTLSIANLAVEYPLFPFSSFFHWCSDVAQSLVQFFFKTKAGTWGWGGVLVFCRSFADWSSMPRSGYRRSLVWHSPCLLSWKLISFADHKGTTNFQIWSFKKWFLMNKCVGVQVFSFANSLLILLWFVALVWLWTKHFYMCKWCERVLWWEDARGLYFPGT